MNARKAIFVLACIGLLAGPVAMGATPVVSDVALAPGGTLIGQVVDTQGFSLPNVEVTVRQPGHTVITTVADRSGRFAVSGLRGGLCQVVAANSQNVFRLWAANTAPPAAKASVMMVSSRAAIVRAQLGAGLLSQWGLPALAAGGIVAGIAVATGDAAPGSP